MEIRYLRTVVAGLIVAATISIAGGNAGATEAQPTAPTHSLTLPSSIALGLVAVDYETQVAPGRGLQVSPQLVLAKVDGQYTAGAVGVGLTYRFYFNGQTIKGWYAGPTARLVYLRVANDDVTAHGVGGQAGAVLGWKGVWGGFTFDWRAGYGVSYNMLTASSGSFSASQGTLSTVPMGDISLGYSW
ncbi:MAG: hypothetical protein IMX01_07370 [Limnochordaceae bacterium]|nr:hypothetical protein [Limnochordaceae bacterium]